MIYKNNFDKYFIFLILFPAFLMSHRSNIEKIETWCYRFCGSGNQNTVFLALLTIVCLFFIFLFLKFFDDSPLQWLLLLPLIFPISTAKGNENRELGLAFLQSNNMEFLLDWNGNIFTEQFLYNLIFKNIGLFFSNYVNFVFFSRLLIGIFFVYTINKIFSNYDKLHVILCIYIVNIFSLSFGGEYLLLGASPRTIAYSFGFLTIYFYIKGNKLYLLFSIVACLFHLHVYYLMVLPYLFFSSLQKKEYRTTLLNTASGFLLLVFFLFTDFNTKSRSNFFSNNFAQNAEGIYINRIIAEQIIPFHVRPFNFDELNNLIGINEYWNIGFVNLLIIFVIYINSDKNWSSHFAFIANINFIFLAIALLVAYVDKNGFLIALYMFKTAVFFSLFLFINNKIKIGIPIFAIIFSLIFTNWFFEFSSNYLETEIKNNKSMIIEEYAASESILVIDNSLKQLFSNSSIEHNFEDYFTGNNLMDLNEITLRNKLNLNANSFCDELNTELDYFVISPTLLNCKEFYLFTINTNYGNAGITGDPFLKYNENNGENFCSESCIRFYKNNQSED